MPQTEPLDDHPDRVRRIVADRLPPPVSRGVDYALLASRRQEWLQAGEMPDYPPVAPDAVED